ncbi:hypothetical protein LGKMAHEF_02642 [Aeromonas salmonicida]
MGQGRGTICLGDHHGSEATLHQHAVEQGFVPLGGVVDGHQFPGCELMGLSRVELVAKQLLANTRCACHLCQ